MQQTLTIVAHARAKPGMEQRMISAQVQLVEATRGAPGCLRYELHVSNQDPAEVTFIEEWESYAAWHAHMNSERITHFRSTAGSMIGEFNLYEMHKVA